MHTPVLIREVVDLLKVDPGGTYLDATAGGGGHASELLKKLKADGQLVLSDRDPEACERLKIRFGSDHCCRVITARFSELFEILNREGLIPLNGLLADLGLSSDQLSNNERGFSFQHEGPLDMRMDPRIEMDASDLISRLGIKELSDLIFRLGEEHHSRKIARAIKERFGGKTFSTTGELRKLAEEVLGPFYRRQRIHPATRLFQALRIAVNRELEELDELLRIIPDVLTPGGRAVIISFHSLEDRIVKRTFQFLKKEGWNLITKKPVVPSREEKRSNPRSRSAKLRVIEKWQES